MTSPIDPVRRSTRARRAVRAAEAAEAQDAARASEPGLPVPVDAPHAVPRAEEAPGVAAFDAHLLGQEGQKRGLRAGPALIETARSLYNRVEWSGSKDRRARKGRKARTEV